MEQGGRAGGADAYSVGGRIDFEGGGGGLIVEGYPANGVQVDEVRIDAGEGHGASSLGFYSILKPLGAVVSQCLVVIMVLSLLEIRPRG